MFASRLYAYTSAPEPLSGNGFVICDSGAFGLSQYGRSIDFAHMQKLNRHYRQYEAGAGFPRVACAPDQYLSPSATMRNWSRWHDAGFCSVAPVIQCQKPKQIDLHSVQLQINFYMPYEPSFIFFSNPGLRSIEAERQNIKYAFEMIRGALKNAWIHVLGAGWDLLDIAAWRKIGPDSIDTIAYYSAAQSGTVWGEAGTSVAETAIHNARAAIKNTMAQRDE